jgi:NAD(P)-dependent dehydrogenase (short-subunit alcohol dehydrogenase family)
MNTPPTEVDAARSVFAESLGQVTGRGRLVGRRIVVVGAGQRPTPPGETAPLGNGRAVSLLAAREGAAVACIDASADAAAASARLIADAGGQAFAEVCDVRDHTAIAPALQRCVEWLGGLDGLVLNVGMSFGRPLAKLTAESWDEEFAVNLRSHMLFSQAALPWMASGGSIVLMSSLAALRNQSRNPAYEVSKAAQVSLTRAIAVAGEAQAIRCNAVLPGLIDTPMGRDATRHRPQRAAAVPFGRQGTAWEVAYATIFLVSNESSYVNAHALVVDGGLGAGIVRTPSA